MTIWEPLLSNSPTCMKGGMIIHRLSRKSDKYVELHVTSKEAAQLALFSFSPSHLPITLSLPQGRLIKTNAVVKCHCYAGAQRAAGSYFSFSLVWWCDFVFFRNRFVSNGSVYLSAPSPILYSLLCRRKDGGLWAAVSDYPQSADFTAVCFFYL